MVAFDVAIAGVTGYDYFQRYSAGLHDWARGVDLALNSDSLVVDVDCYK